MTVFTVTRRLAFAPSDLYPIAADVGSYPSFLPLCTDARISEMRTDPLGRSLFHAAVDIAYDKLSLKETFVSEVIADPAAMRIDVLAIGGPVKHLNGFWLFTPAAGGTDVTFHIDYEMSSRVLQVVMSGMFDYAMRKVLNAFEGRARSLLQSRS
ncbi:MAG: type II toxin-antitoxin system RatA family toxin [Parvibaculaceae bacterium]